VGERHGAPTYPPFQGPRPERIAPHAPEALPTWCGSTADACPGAHRATTPAGTTCSPPAPADADPFGSMPHPAIDPLFITTEGLTEQ
jgi:hypothetical protein